MRFALMIEAQQGLSYEDQLAIARRAESAGFEAFFRSDHYASFPGDSDQTTTDAWAVIAGLARETKTIRLGALVSPVTLRHPGNFVKLVTTVDQMSGGRIEVGVGAGWNEADVQDYLHAYFDTFSNKLQFPYLRIPGAYSYWQALDVHLAEAAAGQLSPQMALKAAAVDFEEITLGLGRDRQRRVYRSSLGF